MFCASATVLKVLAACEIDPTNGVTTYPVTAAPLLAGATHVRWANAFPVVAAGIAGATGAPTLIALDATEFAPVPEALWALTLNV